MIKSYFETELGRLYCGDCFEILPNIEHFELVLTDPPYNVGINYGNTNDKLSIEEYRNNILKLKALIRNKDLMILLGSKTETLLTWWKIFDTAKQIIVMVGASVNTSLAGMRPQYRTILTTRKSNKWWSDLWEDIRFPGEGYFFNEKRFNHPCHAPLRLMKKCLQGFSNDGEIVLDPFAGVGSTLVACEYFNIKWIGIEKEEKYCEIAKQRIIMDLSQNKLPGF